ncbi:hypothetical protein C2G38_2228981 [Gigaspora rosea]|uniref:Uncharacterized protein n=1 Tax=Gigaspora rosea TaxID=44941 RepID=A0A397TZ09_9GLOM|nr:hypothetical protein C2G38_2228981 [Gigaspora rosea]
MNDKYIANIPEHQHCILGTCVLKATEAKYPNRTNCCRLSHFMGKESTCLFVYDLKNREKPVNDETIFQELTLNFCTVEASSPENCNIVRFLLIGARINQQYVIVLKLKSSQALTVVKD